MNKIGQGFLQYPYQQSNQYLNPLQKILDNIIKKPGPLETECWITSFKSGNNPYKYISISGLNKSLPVHRALFIHYNGAPPEDAPHVLHQCHNPQCCNPAHMKWGTNEENHQQRCGSETAKWSIESRLNASKVHKKRFQEPNEIKKISDSTSGYYYMEIDNEKMLIKGLAALGEYFNKKVGTAKLLIDNRQKQLKYGIDKLQSYRGIKNVPDNLLKYLQD